MAEFELRNNKLRITNDGPWSFDKSFILMKEFNGSERVRNIKMVKADFWIWVYDPPLMAQNEYIGWLMENALSELEEIDLDHGEFEWGEFMCLRVTIDISKLLLRCKKLNIGLA